MRSWLSWLGVLTGAISLFSLVQKLWGFGLAPVFKDLITYYRAVFHPIADLITSGSQWLFALISIKLPYIPADAIVIYTLMGASLFRYGTRGILLPGIRPRPLGRMVPKPKREFFFDYFESVSPSFRDIIRGATRGLLYALFWPLAFLGILRVRFVGWFVELGKVIVAFLIVFATNYYFSPRA